MDSERKETGQITYQICNNHTDIKIGSKNLKFFYANIRSLVKPGRLEELKCVIDSINTVIHVIILTETWIKDEDQARRISLSNYTHYYNIRLNTRGGGTSIFVHNNLKHSYLEEQCIDGNHFLWIHLEKFSVDIGAIYKKPAANISNFLEVYNQELSKRKRVIVFGDINLNLLSNEKNIQDYKGLLKENN